MNENHKTINKNQNRVIFLYLYWYKYFSDQTENAQVQRDCWAWYDCDESNPNKNQIGLHCFG